jgi:hypothetical protein
MREFILLVDRAGIAYTLLLVLDIRARPYRRVAITDWSVPRHISWTVLALTPLDDIILLRVKLFLAHLFYAEIIEIGYLDHNDPPFKFIC